MHLMEDESDARIVQSTIDLSRNLGISVVAEGVEDGLTLDRLGNIGCDQAQGYFLSRPLTPDDFAAWHLRRARQSSAA